MVRIQSAVLPPASCAHWLTQIDACAASLPIGHPDLQATSDSLRLPALGTEAFGELLRSVVTGSSGNLPAGLICLVGQCWARRQHPTASRPAGLSPHGWHQDGALHSRFTEASDDALLDITTVWIPLVDCGIDAPSLEWIAAPTPALRLPPELNDSLLAERFGLAARQHARLAAGDALVFGGSLLHRTFDTPAMHRRRVSIELRFIAAGPVPTRLAKEPLIRCSSTR